VGSSRDTLFFPRWRGDDWRRSADRAAGDGCDRAFAEDAGGVGKRSESVSAEKFQNVRVREKIPFAQVPEVQRAIEDAERELDGNGRVVVRYSGTEALARVMVEAESEEKMRALTAGIAGEIQKALGA